MEGVGKVGAESDREIQTGERDDANEQTLLRERERRNTKGSKRDQRWGRVQVKPWNIT